MGGAVYPPCCLTWGQIMVEVMKIMVTSFQRSYSSTAALSAPDSAAGHRWPMSLPETLGYSWASLGQSLVGSLFLSPGSWCAQGFVFALLASVSQSCVSSRGSVVGLMVTSPNRAYAIPKSAAPRAPSPAAVHCCPVPLQETLKHRSGSVSVESLGPGAHPNGHPQRACLSSPSISGGYGVWF